MTSSSILKDRIALVVGASRGIGYESALALATAGAHVVATARTQGGLEDLDDAIFAETGKHATLVPFDLVDGGGIDRLGGAIYERFGKLDIWVQAAATLGAAGLTPVAHLDPRGFAKIEKTNLTAVYRLIRSLEPLLKASDAARVIHLTTSLAGTPRAFWGAYAATKAGAEALMKAWADETESTSLRVSILNPGRMRTAMRGQAYPGEDPETLPHPSELAPLIIELARGDRTPPATIDFKDWTQNLRRLRFSENSRTSARLSSPPSIVWAITMAFLGNNPRQCRKKPPADVGLGVSPSPRQRFKFYGAVM